MVENRVEKWLIVEQGAVSRLYCLWYTCTSAFRSHDLKYRKGTVIHMVTVYTTSRIHDKHQTDIKQRGLLILETKTSHHNQIEIVKENKITSRYGVFSVSVRGCVPYLSRRDAVWVDARAVSTEFLVWRLAAIVVTLGAPDPVPVSRALTPVK